MERGRIRLEGGGGGMRDNEFDLERDNERAGIKIRKMYFITQASNRVGCSGSLKVTEGLCTRRQLTYRHDASMEMKRPYAS